MPRFHLLSVSALLLLCCCAARAQTQDTSPAYTLHPNQEVRVRDLPPLTASSTSACSVLATALATVLHDTALCCGKNSALEDAISTDPQSLQDLSTRLQGKHVVGDGRSIMIHAEDLSADAINPALIISALRDQHALLIQWKSHVYVLYGAIYNEKYFNDGTRQFIIAKLLLLDPRYSGPRHEVEFNRETDNWGNIQGLLSLTVTPQ